MNKSNIILLILITSTVLALIFGTWYSAILSEEHNKLEAKQLLAFHNTDHSCAELTKLYLEYEHKWHSSYSDPMWYWEVRDQFTDKCVDSEALTNLEFIKSCVNSHSVGCEMSKQNYPESYKNFNFNTAVRDLNSTNQKD